MQDFGWVARSVYALLAINTMRPTLSYDRMRSSLPSAFGGIRNRRTTICCKTLGRFHSNCRWWRDVRQSFRPCRLIFESAGTSV